MCVSVKNNNIYKVLKERTFLSESFHLNMVKNISKQTDKKEI